MVHPGDVINIGGPIWRLMVIGELATQLEVGKFETNVREIEDR